MRGRATKKTRPQPGAVPAIVARLERVYGPPRWRSWGDPLSGLVGTILSQHTSDSHSYAAYAELRRRFKSWKAVMEASPVGVQRAIRCGGLAKQKTRFIQESLRRLKDDRGRLSLSFLKEWPPDEAVEYLCRFKGVGRKTAACVLLFHLGKPVLPVDTHIHRVSKRLGLIGPATTADQAHDKLQLLCPSEMVYAFHVLMITHGRRCCRARDPLCKQCCLNDLCPVGRAKRGLEARRGC